MPTEPTSQTLLARLHDPADYVAWQQFELQYRDLILSYCKRRRVQAADAEDISQIVFTSLSGLFRRGFKRDSRRGSFRTYLGVVTRNAVNRWLQSSHRDPRRLSTEVECGLEGMDESVRDEVWEHEWEQHHFRRALRSIRATFEAGSLRIFEALLDGRSVGEVAAEYGTSADAVYKVRSRVRQSMQTLVASQIEEERSEQFPTLP